MPEPDRTDRDPADPNQADSAQSDPSQSDTSQTDPPPAQPAPPTSRSESPPPDAEHSGLDTYHTVSETIGFLPNIRLDDNLIQLISVVIGTALGALSGMFVPAQNIPRAGVVVGCAIGGLIAAVVLSGVALMVLGWVRAANKKRG